jgi:hypothetical protein
MATLPRPVYVTITIGSKGALASHGRFSGHLFPSDDHRKAMDQIAKGLFT